MSKKPHHRQKIYGIIGSSLGHSLSPTIHNHLFGQFEINAAYHCFEVKPGEFSFAIAGIRSLGLDGVNVTFPYKERVLTFIDDLHKTVEETGPANTIKNNRGRLTGYNTDFMGAHMTLSRRLKLNLKGKTVLLLGAGGGARAVLRAALKLGPRRILMVNRTTSKAVALARAFKKYKGHATLEAVSPGRLKACLSDESIALVMQATSADGKYLSGILNSLGEHVSLKDTVVFDLNYAGRSLHGKDRPRGVRYEDGLYMLSAQAAESFRIWTGFTVDPDYVFDYLTRQMRG